ncbi:MAG: hypothetical protein WCP34_12555, partial [Pseudomonadota bacterium]
LLALGALMATLLRRQHKQRKLCLKSLDSLFGKVEQKKFRGLFKGAVPAADSAVQASDPADTSPGSQS